MYSLCVCEKVVIAVIVGVDGIKNGNVFCPLRSLRVERFTGMSVAEWVALFTLLS